MKRAAALAGVLLVVAVLLTVLAPRSASSVRPANWTPVRDLDGTAGARCDRTTAGHEALQRLHEPAVDLRVRSPARMPDDAAGTASRERVTISAALPCSMVWGVVAHETAHVRQFRLTGEADELGADCAASRTGWLRADQWPYLAQRRAHGGPVGCTAAEQLTAARLAPDWG